MILKWLTAIIAIPLVLVVALVAFAMTAPMQASRVLWPVLERIVLADEFIGITTDGNVETGLFQIAETGVSTSELRSSALAFRETLDNEQQSRLMFPVDDLEWRRWANVHLSHRQGVGFLEMNPAQEKAALNLMQAGLSDEGYTTARNIMKLEGHLADLKNDHEAYGEGRYWLTMMGEPTPADPWGWQLDGHHLIVNYFVLGDQVVTTPMFLGSEPTSTTSGRFGALSVFDAEQAAGLALIQSLDEQERAAAIISSEKPGNNNHAELFSDNVVVPLQGLRVATLSNEKQALVRSLIRLHIDNISDGHARIKMAEIDAHWDDTYFAWVGETRDDAVFYYRLQSPVVMIEFDHQTPVALAGPEEPTRDHIHIVIRTPNGNDYGKDLLRQHLQSHPHPGAG